MLSSNTPRKTVVHNYISSVLQDYPILSLEAVSYEAF